MTGEKQADTGLSIKGAELTILFTAFIAATYGFGVYLFSTMIPDMKIDLALTYEDAGTIIALAQVGFLIAAFSSGLLTHRIGSSRLVLLSVFVCGACLLIISFTVSRWQLMGLLVLTGAAAAAVWVPMVALAQAALPAAHQGKALGLMSSGTAYGVFLNGIAIPALLPLYGWRSVWLLMAFLTLLLAVWGTARLKLLVTEAHHTEREVVTSGNMSITSLLRRPISLIVLAMMFFSGIACMPTQNFLMSLFRDELGYSITAASRAWSAIGFTGMFGGFLMGWVADRISVQKALILTFTLLIFAIILFLHHDNLIELYVGAGIFGLAFNAIFGLMPALVSQKFRNQSATTIFGFGNVMLGLGSMAGNYLGGLTKEVFGTFHTIYIVSLVSGIILLALSILIRVQTKHAL